MRTLKELREYYAWTQEELAAKCRVTVGPSRGKSLSRQTICAIENGENLPRPSTRRAIAAALRVRVYEIAWPTAVPADEAAS